MCIEKGIVPESFYISKHQVLFRACVEMVNERKTVDVITLPQYLKKEKELEKAGGDEYIETLLEQCPTDAHAEFYADIVFDCYLKRRLIDEARRIAETGYSNQEAEISVSQAEEAIFKISALKRAPLKNWESLLNELREEIKRIVETKKGLSG
ncbi:MAG: hypothetical protein DRH04_01950, partial [Deltaproteobacteria bacterium]